MVKNVTVRPLSTVEYTSVVSYTVDRGLTNLIHDRYISRLEGLQSRRNLLLLYIGLSV